MEIAEDAIADGFKDSMPTNVFNESQDTISSVSTMNMIETAATAVRQCSLLLEKSLSSGSLGHCESDEEEEKDNVKKTKSARSKASENFDELIQSYQDRLEILTSINCFLSRAKKLVDDSESEMTIFEDNFLLIEESLLLMRSLEKKIQNNSDNMAMLGFQLLEQLHFHLPIVETSSRRSFLKMQDYNALEIIIYEEKELQTDLGKWSKSVNMINTLLEKAEKLTSHAALQNVFGLGRELIKNMSKTVKVCFDNYNRSKDLKKKTEKIIEQFKLYNDEKINQEAELDNLTSQIDELQQSQRKLEETVRYYQELADALLKSLLGDDEKLEAQESMQSFEETETDDSEEEKIHQEVLTLCEEKLQEYKVAAKTLKHNVQKLETKICHLEIIKEKKQQSFKFLESLEQSVKQEHHELTSSEQVQDTVQGTLFNGHKENFTKEQRDASAKSHLGQQSSRPQGVKRVKKTKPSPYYKTRSWKELVPWASKQRDTAKDQSITSADDHPKSKNGKRHPPSPESAPGGISSSRLAEIESIEKMQSQLVLTTILTQLQEMKEFVVKMLTAKEMFELAKKLDSSGDFQTDVDGEQTIKLSSHSFTNVLGHIQTILYEVLLLAAPKKEGTSNMITLTGWTALKEKAKTMENNFANLFRKYQDLWFMYFQLRGKLKNKFKLLMIRRKQKLSMYKKRTFQQEDTSEMPHLEGTTLQTSKVKFSDLLNMDVPESWNEDFQNIQAAFAEGGIDKDTYMESLVLMLKLAAVLQQKQALLGEGFMMKRLKQSLTAKVQKILQAVSSEDFPLHLLMKIANYDNYTAFLRQMNEEDKKIRLEQEKLLLFMKLKLVYEKIKDRTDRRKSSVNTVESVAEETQEPLESSIKPSHEDFAQFKSHLKPVREHCFSVTIGSKKNHQMRIPQSLTAYLPAAARLEDQTPTFLSYSLSGIPKVIRSLTEIQTQTILEEAEEVSEKLASEEGEELCPPVTLSEKFSLLQKFNQKKLTKEEFSRVPSSVLEIASPEATLPHLQKNPRKLEEPSSHAEMVSTVHTVLSKHHGFKLPLQRPLPPFNSLMLTLPPMPTLPTEKGPCPKKVRTGRYSISSKTLTSVPAHTSYFHRHKEEYVIPCLSSPKKPTFPQIHLKHEQLEKIWEEIQTDRLAPSLSSSQKRLSCASSPEFTPRSPQNQTFASYPDQIQAHTEYNQNEEYEFSSLKQEALGDHRASPAGSESKILPEEKKQEVSLPFLDDEQSIFPLDQPSTTTRSKDEVSHLSEVKVIDKNVGASLSDLSLPSSSTDLLQFMELQSDKKVTLKKKVLNRVMFPEILPDPVSHYQAIRHLLLQEIPLKGEQLKNHQEKLSKRLPRPSSQSVLDHKISPELASKPPQMDSNPVLMQTHIKDLHKQIMNEATVQRQRLPQHEASSQHLILNVKKWIHQIEQKVEERQNGKPATLPAVPKDLISLKDLLMEESKFDLALSSLDFEYNLNPGLPANEDDSLSLDRESILPKCEGIQGSTTHKLQTLSKDSDDRNDLSDSSLREMTAFGTEIPLLFYLDVDQSRRKASRILNLMVCQDLTKIPTEPSCQHLWNKFLSEH